MQPVRRDGSLGQGLPAAPRRERAGSREGPRQPKPDDVCKKCGQTGHWARDCPSGDGAKAADADGDANMDASALDNDLDAYKAEGAAADEDGAAEEMVDARERAPKKKPKTKERDGRVGVVGGRDV